MAIEWRSADKNSRDRQSFWHAQSSADILEIDIVPPGGRQVKWRFDQRLFDKAT
ncbi:hypothetical protein IQ268_14295 [Oculatella sp. LEGE 06141]|uniref:hypothetical protein n=1 Tax=Oculatella sp. LEGE 06141 TaxID=1828648 RepID=UPI001880971C|nr:hypothetical protein [Oculatella sp. LEGE 06141]MBE9179736.1 hypothetical protein [Oculatella sp. LEGE 06141]